MTMTFEAEPSSTFSSRWVGFCLWGFPWWMAGGAM